MTSETPRPDGLTGSDSPLPTAQTARWQPLRSGLLNLFLFEDEVFHYERGRLLLRGNNGTGKSRVLALQLPFLLDGEVHPHRVEPDGDPAKRMEWHLLMNGRYPDRIGYSWIEFGRRDDDGGPQYCTLGVGMQAIQGRGAPTRWYFTTDRRIGLDLQLMTESRTPLTRPRLTELLGERGEVYQRAAVYREAVDRLLFRLGRERYEALLELLIQLRRPQLSRRLDEAQLNRAFSDAMPPLSESVLGEVAEAFRGLEQDREALGTFQTSVQATERFIKPYRRYAQIATRRRAARVRRAHADYESTLRALHDSEARAEQAERDQAECLERLDLLRQALAAAEVEVHTLESSEEMRSARELERATEEARRSAEEKTASDARLAEAERALLSREMEHVRASGERRDRQTEAREDLATCEGWASRAELARPFRALAETFAGLLDEPDGDTPLQASELADLEEQAGTSLGLLRERVDERRRAAHHLESRQSEWVAVKARFLEQERTCERRAEDLAESQERHQEEVAARQSARTALLEAYRQWAQGVVVLGPPGAGELEDDLTAWAVTGHGACPLVSAATAAFDEALVRLHAERAEWEARLQEDEALVRSLQEEMSALRQGRHRPPPAPETRDLEARQGRAGAPLWALCEFEEETDPAERAGLEAALQAAGLLDAWLTPEGRIVGPEPLDVWLEARRDQATGPTLADKLRPLREEELELGDAGAALGAVDGSVVRSVLRRIGVGETDEPVWVDVDGRYQLGPARGVWRKEHAEHLGASAREAARLRRIAELELTLEEAHKQVEKTSGRLQMADDRVRQARKERQEAPGDEALRDALAALTQAEREVVGRRRALEDAEERAQQLREDASTLRAEIDEEADELGLTTWFERLTELREHLAQLEQALHGLRRWIRQLRVVMENEHSSATREQQAREHRAARHREAQQARGRAMRSESARQVLEETVGARAQEVIERLHRVRGRQARFRDEQETVGRRERDADRALVEARADHKNHEVRLEEHVERRQEAVDGLARLVDAGLASLAGVSLDGDGEPGPVTSWSPTRAVDLARRVERHLAQVDVSDRAWDRANGALHRSIAELETELGVHGWRPQITEQDALRLVTVMFQGQERSLDELARLLREEVAQRERLLAESERQVIENHLIDEVSAQLHERLREGERLVVRMNEELDARPTSTGMRLRFGWQPRKDEPAGWPDARRLLLATRTIWSPKERRSIGQFLQQRIEAVRLAERSLTWRDQLAEAFDYRRWHTFVVSRFQDGAWHRLTRRTHGTGSGGEKALALTLPQLAAAAAHYGGAHPNAPRLILLDEAFVGVDRTMRGHCMGLLAAFDLDFVMTSEREWGCYSTVDALAIYQLTRHPDLDAIYTTRWVWNGAERRRSDDLAQAPGGGPPP